MPSDDAPFPPLNVARVRTAVAGTRFGDIRYSAETGSTNDDAAAILGEERSGGATLVAEFQTAGKGRKAGRSWIAPRGTSLLFTVILPVRVDVRALWATPFWTALAVATGIERACGVRVDLRWPNDCDLAGRKVAGILCVSRVSGDRAHVACGIGINVTRSDGADEAIAPPPAFLSDASANSEREAILADILHAMDDALPQLNAADTIVRDYEARAALDGTPYRMRLDADGTEIAGIARGIKPGGALRLQTPDGERAIDLADARVARESGTP